VQSPNDGGAGEDGDAGTVTDAGAGDAGPHDVEADGG